MAPLQQLKYYLKYLLCGYSNDMEGALLLARV